MSNQAANLTASGSRPGGAARSPARWKVAVSAVVVLAAMATGAVVARSGRHLPAWSDPWNTRSVTFGNHTITLHYPRSWIAIHPTGPQSYSLGGIPTLGWLTSAKPYRQCRLSPEQKSTIPVEQLTVCNVPVDQLGPADIYLKVSADVASVIPNFSPNMRIDGRAAQLTSGSAFLSGGAYRLSPNECPAGTGIVALTRVSDTADRQPPVYFLLACLGPKASMRTLRHVLSSVTFGR